MGLLALQALGQVDDRNSLKWALLNTDTTTNAQLLANIRQLAVGSHLNALLALPNHGTLFAALLATLLGLALLLVNNRNTSQTAVFLLFLLGPHDYR